jgi:hypothetical protein
MGLWRQLRWRIIAAHMLVVIVGVLTLIVTAETLAARSVDPALLPVFQSAVIQALVVAALAATIAGLATSILLVRESCDRCDNWQPAVAGSLAGTTMSG